MPSGPHARFINQYNKLDRSLLDHALQAVAENNVAILDAATEKIMSDRSMPLELKVLELRKAIENLPPDSPAIGYLIDVISALAPVDSIPVLIAEYKRGRLSAVNSAILLRGLANSISPEHGSSSSLITAKDSSYRIVPNSPEKSVMNQPTNVASHSNIVSEVSSLLMTALPDSRPVVAESAVVAFSRVASASDALFALRQAYQSKRLDPIVYFRETIGQLPNLNSRDQETLIDEIVASENLHLEAVTLTNSNFLIALLADRQFVESLSFTAREKLGVYLINKAPRFNAIDGELDVLAGVQTNDWLVASAWLSGVAMNDISRFLLNYLISSRGDANTVLSVLMSPYAEDIVKLSNLNQRDLLKVKISSFAQGTSKPLSRTAAELINAALVKVGA